MGVNDYLTRPVDKNELVARVRTQLRKKRYADRLRQNVQLSLEMAITDQLTGLHNRRYMSRHLDNLVGTARNSHKPIAFVIMDIDFFKAVNDTHGHDIGDEVLKEFAGRIAANVRGIDLACRVSGGEEFVVVMPDTDMDFAYSVSERLRKSIETTPFPISRAPKALNLTISIRYRLFRRGQRHGAGAVAPRRPGALSRQAFGPQPRRSPTQRIIGASFQHCMMLARAIRSCARLAHPPLAQSRPYAAAMDPSSLETVHGTVPFAFGELFSEALSIAIASISGSRAPDTRDLAAEKDHRRHRR